MTVAVDDPSRALRSFATQFASVPHPGPVDIEVTVERTGKSMTTTSARLSRRDACCRSPTRRARRLGPASPTTTTSALATPTPARRPRFASPDGVGHFQNADVRLDPTASCSPADDEAWVAAWLRPLEGEPIDAAWLVAMCDLLPPAVFAAPPARSRRRRSSTSCTWPPSSPRYRPASTSTSRVARRCRTKDSRSRTPPCGHPTVTSSRSPVRPASPACELGRTGFVLPVNPRSMGDSRVPVEWAGPLRYQPRRRRIGTFARTPACPSGPGEGQAWTRSSRTEVAEDLDRALVGDVRSRASSPCRTFVTVTAATRPASPAAPGRGQACRSGTGQREPRFRTGRSSRAVRRLGPTVEDRTALLYECHHAFVGIG